ncbi:ATP-binding protein [Geodermatophilus sp. SYSU D00691]
MRVAVRLLGGFGVVVDGRAVAPEDWRRRSASALVKLLALAPGHRLRREQVVDALWPDLLVDEALPRLHKAAHFARGALGARDAVVLADDAVSLFPGVEVTVDVEEFERADDADTALGHWRGDLLPDDAYEPWTEEPRRRLRLRHLELLRAAGRWADLAAADPLDEEAALHVVREHVAAGRRADALRRLQHLEETLRRELGTAPGRAAAALRAEALRLPVDGGPRPARATPVPLPATPTVGRDADRDRVLELLETSRVVTLVGPGGVGKTRLAAEVALARTGATGVPAVFVDLTRVSDPRLVADLVAGALGVHVGTGGDPERALAELLRRRELLLVLDNFEHVLAAAPVVGRLAATAPDVRFLCTSRARLRIAGERLHDVAPLATADDAGSPAVALFAQAAEAVDPGFDLAAHLPEVVAICRQVDGLPLAIELAAGHVRTLSPALLRARLGARLGSPDGAPRDSHPRQLTIPATVDWSLQLLGAAERELFAALGVFAGPVPVAAVEQVCADVAPDVLASLSRLVDQSLVRRGTGPDGEPRFRLLELLRERARELLPAEAAADLRARRARWVADVLEGLDAHRWTAPDAWLDRVGELMPEIRAARADTTAAGDLRTAARIAGQLGTYWHREGRHDEGRPWVGALLEAADRPDAPLDAPLVARLHLAEGFLWWTVDVPRARTHLVAAAELFRGCGPDRYLAYALGLAGVTFVGDPAAYAAALRQVDESIALARRVGEGGLTAQVLTIRGELTRVHGDDDLARTAYEEALRLSAEVGDGILQSMLLANLGYLAEHRGDHEEARVLHRRGIHLCWSSGRRLVAAWLLAEVAGPEAALGRPERGALLVGAADAALRGLGNDRAPSDRPEYRRVVRTLRAALGDAAFERAAAEGAQLSLDEAVELAMTEPAVQPA